MKSEINLVMVIPQAQNAALNWVAQTYKVEKNLLCAFATIKKGNITVRVRTSSQPSKEWGVSYDYTNQSCLRSCTWKYECQFHD